MPTDEQRSEWEALKTAWQNRRRRVMPSELFRALFTDSSLAREAVQLAKQSPFFRQALKGAADGVVQLSDCDVQSVWIAVQDDDGWEDLFAHCRNQLNAGDSAHFVRRAVSHVLYQKGRKFVKARALKWWGAMANSEEQQEALIKVMVEKGIRSESVFRALGSGALNFARREAAQYRDPVLDGDLVSQFSTGAGNPATERVASRFDTLFADVTLAADLRDACLTSDEYSRVAESAQLTAPSWTAFARALRRLQRFQHPMMDEFAEALTHFVQAVPSPVMGVAGPSRLRFPILRLLHLQQILEAPRLSKVVKDPALVMVPDVVLYLMGRDDVLFQPELRVLRGSDRRWRARWVENAGEAVATMFLEDSVRLDLSTLARIPEKRGSLTPDFMAATTAGGKLVFESKGSSDWKTHLGQRKQALHQLGKDYGESENSWGSDGRTFACCLFAAQQGDERASLLHVDDPPFQFEDRFPEGWELHCRREHAIAMLEAARLFARADDVARQRRSVTDSNREAVFRLRGGDGPEGESFLGTYLPVEEWARSLRHPHPRECERIRVFVGVQEELARQFEQGKFLSLVPTPDAMKSVNPPAELDRGPRIGLLPGQESQGVARGMYSVLADGAFMAIEF